MMYAYIIKEGSHSDRKELMDIIEYIDIDFIRFGSFMNLFIFVLPLIMLMLASDRIAIIQHSLICLVTTYTFARITGTHLISIYFRNKRRYLSLIAAHRIWGDFLKAYKRDEMFYEDYELDNSSELIYAVKIQWVNIMSGYTVFWMLYSAIVILPVWLLGKSHGNIQNHNGVFAYVILATLLYIMYNKKILSIWNHEVRPELVKMLKQE